MTSEHCLFIDGAFIPVHMLVNGEQAESHLASRNRHLFLFQQGEISDAAAQLQTERSFVELIFNRLLARARKVYPELVFKQGETVSDSALVLKTDTYQSILPSRRKGEWLTFMLPEEVDTIWPHSRVARPADTIGPFVDGRRHLGVLVGEMKIFTGEATYALNTHLQESEVSGWAQKEPNENYRWTSGHARVDLRDIPDATSGSKLLSVQVVLAGLYLLNMTGATGQGGS